MGSNNVIICIGEPQLRKLIAILIETEPGFEVIDEYTDAGGAIVHVETRGRKDPSTLPDLLVVEWNGDASQHRAVRHLVASCPDAVRSGGQATRSARSGPESQRRRTAGAGFTAMTGKGCSQPYASTAANTPSQRSSNSHNVSPRFCRHPIDLPARSTGACHHICMRPPSQSPKSHGSCSFTAPQTKQTPAACLSSRYAEVNDMLTDKRVTRADGAQDRVGAGCGTTRPISPVARTTSARRGRRSGATTTPAPAHGAPMRRGIWRGDASLDALGVALGAGGRARGAGACASRPAR